MTTEIKTEGFRTSSVFTLHLITYSSEFLDLMNLSETGPPRSIGDAGKETPGGQHGR